MDFTDDTADNTSPLQVLVEALFNIAARKEYVQPLREEIEDAIKQHGWTKDAFTAMRKFDSFIKESSRTGGLGSRTLLFLA